MPRLTYLRLDREPELWKRIPMVGSSLGVEVVPLFTQLGQVATLCRFPAGFRRDVVGGYLAAEEFLMLDGKLELEGVIYQRGDLVFVPASYKRTRAVVPHGCTVLAWFSGLADFITAEKLNESDPGPIRATSVFELSDSEVMTTSHSKWTYLGQGRPVISGENVELITTDLSTWAYGSAIESVERMNLGYLLRTPIGAF